MVTRVKIGKKGEKSPTAFKWLCPPRHVAQNVVHRGVGATERVQWLE